MDGGGGGAGRFLAGCGCLTWLAAVLLVISVQVLIGLDLLPYDLYAATTPVTYGGACCSALAFVVALVGVVMMLMGPRGDA